MKAILSCGWELSDEHAASSYGQPVLVNRRTGDVYGPLDVIELHPEIGAMPAAQGVRMMPRTYHMEDREYELVFKFWPPGMGCRWEEPMS